MIAGITQHTSPADSDPVKLLALDGGGIRGISELLILNEIMCRIQHDEKLAEIPRPCDYFDLIGGTSTGGRIALMLGRLRMTTTEALQTYNSLARAIFSKDNRKWTGQDGAFKASTLEKLLQEVVLKKDLGDFMLDPSHYPKKGKVFVCAARANNMGSLKRFRTYAVRENASANCKIWEAARATTAAPTFFKRIAIGEEGQAKEDFIDVGLGYNNPANQVLEEAYNVFGYDKLVSCLISIGTGHPGTILGKPHAFQKRLPTDLVNVLKDIATGCETTATSLSTRCIHLANFYCRFNGVDGVENISLKEWEKMGELTEHTMAYMADPLVNKATNEVVDILRKSRRSEQRLEVFVSCCGALQICNASKTFWNVPFAHNRKFVGRQTQLGLLQHALFSKDHPPKIAITSLGGMGKPQIALHMAHWTKEKYPGCSVLWIQATNVENLQQGFTNLGQILGVPGIREEKAEPKKLVQRHLSQEFIVDNLDNMEIWKNELRDCLPRSQKGCVLCTMRSRKVAVTSVATNIMEVPEMDSEVAIQLLSKSLIGQELLSCHQVVAQFLEQLTFLPLAIVQAAAYINAIEVTVLEHLSLLNKQEQDVIELLSED